MKKIKSCLRLAVGAFFILIVTPSAFAQDMGPELFFEPSITYETGRPVVSYPPPLGSSKGHVNGFGLGARFGLHFLDVFFVGLDGRYSIPQYRDSSVDYNAKSVSTNWGPTIGMQFPDFRVKLWGTAILGGDLNPEGSGTFDVKFEKSEGFRLGLGIPVANVNLNIEYQRMKYDRTLLEGLGPFTASHEFNRVTVDNNSWIASVSFPLAL